MQAYRLSPRTAKPPTTSTRVLVRQAPAEPSTRTRRRAIAAALASQGRSNPDRVGWFRLRKLSHWLAVCMASWRIGTNGTMRCRETQWQDLDAKGLRAFTARTMEETGPWQRTITQSMKFCPMRPPASTVATSLNITSSKLQSRQIPSQGTKSRVTARRK